MQIPEAEAREVFNWYRNAGMNFKFGSNEQTELTEFQVLQQCRMYIAAMRIADEFVVVDFPLENVEIIAAYPVIVEKAARKNVMAEHHARAAGRDPSRTARR